MHEKLEEYLGEISHYLAVRQGADEILKEIRSHILEKAEAGSGAVTEESLQKTIAAYGSPRDVAAKYMEGQEIISPTFGRHLVRYTWLLFAIHCVLTAVAVSLQIEIIAIPFFIIPKMPVWAALVYLPMALVYDFGVVALVLYYVTQKKGNVRLPWFGVKLPPRGESSLEKPKPWGLATLIAIFGLLLYVFIRFHTLFFYTINFHRPISLLDPSASVFFSILLLTAFACNIAGYWIRFIYNTAWVKLAEHTIVLLILWLAWNSPIKPVFRDVPGIDMDFTGGGIILFLIVVYVFEFLRSLVRVAREMGVV